MSARLLAVLLLLAQANAHNFPWRIAGRGIDGNDTASFTNTTSTSVLVDPTISKTSKTSSSTHSSTITDKNPPASTPTPTSQASETPTRLPGPGSDGGACGSTVTYHGSVYPTVYETITEGFDVTLSAPTATMTESETLITPEQACSSTVVPLDPEAAGFTAQGSMVITVEPASTTSFPTMTPYTNTTWEDAKPSSSKSPGVPFQSPPSTTKSGPGKGPQGVPADDNGVDNFPPGPSKTVVPVQTFVPSGVPYTSTVIVTKKTPIPVFQQQTILAPPPPPNFDPGPAGPAANPPAGPGNNPGDPANRQPTATPINPNIANPANTFLFPSQSPGIVPQTTIANIPVAVRPSFIQIGNTAVPIPVAGNVAVVTQGGVEFVVRPDQIVAPSTTVGFRPLGFQQANVVSVEPTRVTAAPGVVIEVGASSAVVAGTTYRIASDFSTVVTVSGQRISIGPSGVILPSTTIVPAGATPAPLITSVGQVTFTLSGSSVIIGTATYGIGADSPEITTTINGDKVSFGPGGVAFASTTILPTSAPTGKSSDSGTDSSTATSTGTAADTSANGGAASLHLGVLSILASAIATLAFLL